MISEIHLAAAQAEISLFDDGYDLPGQSETHGTTSVLDASTENSLAKCNFAIVG